MSQPPRLKPFSLFFTEDDHEAAFRAYHIEQNGAVTRNSVAGGVALTLAFFAYKLVFAGDLHRNWQMLGLMSIVVFTLLVVRFLTTRLLKTPLLVCLVYTGVMCVILAVTRDFPLERRRLTSGFFISAVLFNAVMPYGWREIFLTNALTMLGFFGLARLDGVYDEAAYVQLFGQFAITAALATFISYVMKRTIRMQFVWRRLAQAEQEKSESLLSVILPPPIAERLKAGEQAIVDQHPTVTVLFADVVGFTHLSATRSAKDTALILNDVFQRFDAVARQLGIEKVKTIGDAYMAVAGAPLPCKDHARLAAEMALEIREALVRYRAMTGLNLEIRVGLDSGPVAAGIIGKSRFLYDYWGDTVNFASRMESTGLPGQVQISARTAGLLQEHYELTPRRGVEVKGLGLVDTYILVRPKVDEVTRKPAA